MKTKERTKSGKSVTVRTMNVGFNFGCFAVVEYRGKRLAETRVFPYGMDVNAHSAACNKLDDL